MFWLSWNVYLFCFLVCLIFILISDLEVEGVQGGVWGEGEGGESEGLLWKGHTLVLSLLVKGKIGIELSQISNVPLYSCPSSSIPTLGFINSLMVVKSALEFPPNDTKPTKFLNFDQISEYFPNFRMLTKNICHILECI